MLCRLGLMLLAALDIRYKANMNEQAILKTNLERNLSNSLKKRLALYIADCTTDFGDNNISVRVLTDSIDKFLNFVCI